MRVKCPKCGHEFEVAPTVHKFWESDIEIPYIEFPSTTSMESALYCGPYKEIHLSCGHSFRCEFSQFHKGQKTWCGECEKEVEVVKCIDTVTGKEYDRL